MAIDMITAKLKIASLFIILFTVTYSSFGQDPLDDIMIDSLIDELFFKEDLFVDDILESAYDYNLIYASASFNSNTFISGRDTDTDQFNIIPQVSFFNSKGLTASISGIYYNQYTPHWGYTNLSLGYFNYIGKKQLFNYSAGYSRYFYGESYDTLTNTFDLNLGFKNNKRTFGTKLLASYIFGNGYSFQFISKTYANMKLIKKSKLVLKFRPEISFIFADRTYTNEESFNITYFGLLYSQLSLPINLLTKSWDLELGCNINFPLQHEFEADVNPTGYLYFSVGYLIDFTK